MDVAQAGKTPEVEGWYWHGSGFRGLFLVQMMDPEPKAWAITLTGGRNLLPNTAKFPGRATPTLPGLLRDAHTALCTPPLPASPTKCGIFKFLRAFTCTHTHTGLCFTHTPRQLHAHTAGGSQGLSLLPLPLHWKVSVSTEPEGAVAAPGTRMRRILRAQGTATTPVSVRECKKSLQIG